jgi:hypothetical protein
MSEYLTWALGRAREHTLTLVDDIPSDAMQRASAPGEKHPTWILGHLLLADTYLIFLLGLEPLADDAPLLLEHFGPASVPTARPDYYSKLQLIERLRRANVLRLGGVVAMSDLELAQPTPDAHLAQAQPTIGHHLHSLVFHEGYHAGQLSAWRKAHGLTAVHWTLGPPRTPTA